MKLKNRTKYVIAAPLFVVASLALQLSHALPTYAASLSWTGAGDGTSFSDGDNWSTGTAPVNGDAVTFSVAGLSSQRVLDNDISSLSVAGITFTGAVNQYNTYTLQGDPLTLTGPIANTITGANAGFAIPTIQNNLTLGANVTASKVNIGVQGSTLNLGSYSFGYTGASDTCGLTVYSDLSGSGSFSIAGDAVNVRGTNTSYAGPIAVTGNAIFAPAAFGAASAGTTVSGAGNLNIVHTSNVSLAEPFTFGGTGSLNAVQSFYGCSGGDGPASTLTLTGGVTLTSNFLANGTNNVVVTAPYTANGHTFTVKGGATGTLTTPEGEQSAPEETVQLDGDSSTFVNIGNKQTGVLNGTRDTISVSAGGILKGTGTVNDLGVQQDGRVNPGNSPGTLTVLESFSLGGTYDAEILNAGTYDKLVVGENYTGGSNAVSLFSGSTLNAILFDGWSVKQGDAFTIIDNRSSTAVQGTFDGLNEGAQFTVGSITFSITYVGGDGNDVVLTALNTGTDPSAPNTGVARFAQANPLAVAGLGIVAAGLILAIALRRRAQQ